MIRRRIREDLGETGWKAKVIKLLNFIFIPLRYPFVTICVLVVAFLLYVIPTFMGAEYNNVHIWYLNKLKQYVDLEDDVEGNDLTGRNGKATQIVKSVKINDDAKPKARKSFQKATNAVLKAIDVLKNEEVVKPKKKVRKKQTTDKFGLTYLNVPQKISSQNVVVLNANEIVVGKNRLFLHGIYVNPQTNDGMMAKDFLIDLISGKDVDCMLVAYTKTNDYTALCYVGDIEINRLLVDKGYSENKALK